MPVFLWTHFLHLFLFLLLNFPSGLIMYLSIYLLFSVCQPRHNNYNLCKKHFY